MKLVKVTFSETYGVHIDGLGTVRVMNAPEFDVEVTPFGLLVRHDRIIGRAFVPMHKVESGLEDMLPSVSDAPPGPGLDFDALENSTTLAKRGPGRPPKNAA